MKTDNKYGKYCYFNMSDDLYFYYTFCVKINRYSYNITEHFNFYSDDNLLLKNTILTMKDSDYLHVYCILDEKSFKNKYVEKIENIYNEVLNLIVLEKKIYQGRINNLENIKKTNENLKNIIRKNKLKKINE